MTACAEIKFSNCCNTKVLKEDKLFISAVPGSIVFGEVCPTGFVKHKYFKFNHYQLFELYLALVSVIKFQVSESDSSLKGLILSLNDEELYFWNGSKVTKNGTEIKIVRLGIEFQFVTTFEILFDSEELLNEFIYIISQMIFPCLCLNQIELEVFEFASQQDLSILITLNRMEDSQKLLNSFQIKSKIKIDSIIGTNIVNNLMFYQEILILHHKILSIHNPINNKKMDRIAKILEA